MSDDATLLRQFAAEGNERAFAELVRRHVDLVYGAALRRTHGDTQRAAEVAQLVFTALAQQAHRLAPNSVLAAWLHTATRNAAIKLMTSEQRRRRREGEAVLIGTAGPAAHTEVAWDDVRPLLDTLVDELPERDRSALVLRFFERQTFGEIGHALGVSEDAARMRTERALEKLRIALGRRGVRSSAAALAAVVSHQAVIAAPAGLAASVATHALGVVAIGAVAGGAISFMSGKLIGTAICSALVAFFIGGYVGNLRNAPPEPQPDPALARLTQTVGSLRTDNERLQAEAVALRQDMAELSVTNGALAAKAEAAEARALAAMPPRKSPNIGMVRHELQQAVLNNLRQIAAARDQFKLERGIAPESVDTLVGPKGFIRTIRTVGGEDYSGLELGGSGPLTVTTPDGIEVTYDPAGVLTTKPDVPPEVVRVRELAQKVKPAIDRALATFRAANNGNNPANEQALLPYFATPEEGADFLEFVEAQKAGVR